MPWHREYGKGRANHTDEIGISPHLSARATYHKLHVSGSKELRAHTMIVGLGIGQRNIPS